MLKPKEQYLVDESTAAKRRAAGGDDRMRLHATLDAAEEM
jgi:hypothetical protein